MTKQTLTQERLKELVSYNPETGVFIRKVNKPNSKTGSVIGVLQNRGYLKASIGGKEYLLHRLAWFYVYGCFPLEQIDHINHNKTDNRIANLRSCSSAENQMNVSLRKDNKSGFSGVCWCDSNCKWRVRLRAKKKTHHIGYFECLDDAIKARVNANIKHGFHANHGVLANG